MILSIMGIWKFSNSDKKRYFFIFFRSIYDIMLKKLNFQFYLYYLLLLLFIFLGVNKVNAMPSFMPSLSAYSVSYKSSSEQYDITFVVEGGSRSCSGDIMLIGAEPLIPEPALFSCNIFNPDEFQTFNTSINNISEQVSGKLSMKIQVHKWGHIYESQYKILIIGSGNSETAPPVINFTEYIDININITNEITFVFPDSQFKLMILGAAVFTSAALYVKAESPIRNNKEEVKNIFLDYAKQITAEETFEANPSFLCNYCDYKNYHNLYIE